MANTYSQIYIQVVFAVQGRPNLIQKQNKEELHKYMTGIVRERDQKLLAVHCMPDHTHMLLGLRPSMALSDVVRDVKNGSTNFINGSGWVMGRFSWQEGFGAFSYGHSQLKVIMDYIRDQERHHELRSFRDEYRRFLKRYEIEHDEKYLFKPLDRRWVRSPLRGLPSVARARDTINRLPLRGLKRGSRTPNKLTNEQLVTQAASNLSAFRY